MHQDHFALILLELVLVIGLGLFGRLGAQSFNQSGVLGELVIGVICATLVRLAGGSFEAVVHDLHTFGEIGVVLLLFQVGLETKIQDMIRVGPAAVKVAMVGVFVPVILGLGCGYALLSEATFATQLFIGATLCATSVGISARVFKDLKRLSTPEAKLVLGAAVIDDILGLVILAVVSGIAAQGDFQMLPLVKTLLITALFLGSVIWFGEPLAKISIENLEFVEGKGRRFIIPLMICFLFSWLAGEIGLATIVGAFAAGLVLKDSHYATAGESIHQQIAPLESLFSPVFFVLMGLQVDLTVLMHGQVFLLAAVLCVAAVLGKLACVLVTDKKINGLLVAIGMIPRGEVGLIFAGVGKYLEVLDDELFSALVVMIIFTTLIAPPALRWAIAKQDAEELPPPPAARA